MVLYGQCTKGLIDINLNSDQNFFPSKIRSIGKVNIRGEKIVLELFFFLRSWINSWIYTVRDLKLEKEKKISSVKVSMTHPRVHSA